MRFDSYHPTINLIYFTAAIGLAICFNHPVYVAISYAVAFAYSVKLSGKRAVIFNWYTAAGIRITITLESPI